MTNSVPERRKYERVPASMEADLRIIGLLSDRERPLQEECQQAKVVDRNEQRIVVSTMFPLKTGDFIKMNIGVSDKPASGIVLWVLSHEGSCTAEVLIL